MSPLLATERDFSLTAGFLLPLTAAHSDLLVGWRPSGHMFRLCELPSRVLRVSPLTAVGGHTLSSAHTLQTHTCLVGRVPWEYGRM